MMTYHVQFLPLVLAGWVNRQQQDVIDYQQEENRVLRAGLRGKRVVSKNTNALKAHAIMAGLDRAINAGSTFCGAQPADRRLIKFGARG